MRIRSSVIQILGVALIATGFAAGLYSTVYPDAAALIHSKWFGVLMLGLFARSSGEAAALRLKHSDKAPTMTKKELGYSLVLAIILMGAFVWIAK